ncbi:hypothetical protein BCR34DRAFT_594036 [Clohesyomyces aquaticus]|uniref:Uncharacterized protein n=1 Tax=Clohesyomyces aquaticus TaxID=1231657 RepID=A0A1Y1YD30_9PLEO|nr:hypothetical protein BCR34DRAFT_594036 [Clohesyomyces aquaticus]
MHRPIFAQTTSAVLQNWLVETTNLENLREAINLLGNFPNLRVFTFASLAPNDRLVTHHVRYGHFLRNLHHFILHAANEYILQCVVEGREPVLRFQSNFAGAFLLHSRFRADYAIICANLLDTEFERDLMAASIQLSVAWRARGGMNGNGDARGFQERREGLDGRVQDIQGQLMELNSDVENWEPMPRYRNIFDREEQG